MKEIDSDFLERLLTSYDPDIDLSEGGPAWTQVIQPILDRLDPDPLEVDFQEFALALLRDRFPDLAFETGDALSGAVAEPAQFLMRPLLDQMAVDQRLQSLHNWTLMSEEEMDARLTNFFHSREAGGLARGPVRLYFENPTTQSVSSGNSFLSKTGLRYFPSLPQSIASDTMLSNKDGNLYYFDVYVTAENEGEDYNVDVGGIVRVTGMPQAVRVTNLRKFRGGLDKETNEEALISAQQAITEESLTSSPGIFTKVRRNVNGIRRMRTVGYGDAEMTRDIIRGGSAGSVVSWAIDGRIINDGDGDNKSQIFESPLTDFTQVIGPVGVLEDTWLLSLLGADHVVEEVLSPIKLKLADEIDLMAARPVLITGADLITNAGSPILESGAGDFVAAGVTEGNAIQILAPSADAGYYKILELNYGGDPSKVRVNQNMTTDAGAQSFVVPHGHPWYLRRKYLTLSSVPGGFITETEAEIPDDEIHIGGMVDVYAAGEVMDDNVTLLAVADQNPIVSGIDLKRIDTETVESVGTDLEESGVIPGHYLVIQEGTQAGIYRILKVDGYQAQVDGNLALTFTDIRFMITDVVDCELTDPRETRISGTDLKVTLGTQNAVTVPLIDFSSYGVIAGDYLRILAGPDEGDHVITSVTGTGNTVVVVNHTWTASYVGLSYEIYRKGEAVDLPLVSVDVVEILDSNEEPTGVEVPYADPMLAEARSPFENVGDGVLVSYTSGVQLGIMGSIDLTTIVGAAIAGKILYLTVDGTDYSIVFAVTDTAVQDVVDKIEAQVSDIAFVHVHGIEKRLVLQSVDRVITVWYTGANNANSVLGFDTTRNEYNDQIVISDGTVDLEAYGVTTRSVVNVTSQDSPGYYKVTDIGGTASHYYARAYSVFSSRKYWLSSVEAEVDIGMTSHGVVRLYFRDPTYLQVQGPSELYSNDAAVYYLYPWMDLSAERRQRVTKFLASVGGASYSFYPDPDKDAILIPADSGSQPNNGQVVIDAVTENKFESNIVGAGVIDGRSTRIDFLDWWIVEGDVLDINTYALVGDIDLAAAAPLALDSKYLKIRLDGYLFTFTFDANDTTLDDVIDRINQDTGETLAAKHDSNKYLVLESDKEFTLEADGTADDLTGILLRTDWVGVITSNVPSVAGQYLIYELNTGGDHHHMRVRRLSDGADVYLDRMSAADAVNAGKTAYFNHRTDAGGDYHTIDDGANILAASTITHRSSVVEIRDAWNDLILKYNAHDANNLGNYHTPPASQHQYGAGGVAVTIQDVLDEYVVFRPIWAAHLADVTTAGAHALADTADLLSENVDDNINLHFEIKRRSCQRISPAVMATQQTPEGFYYADIEVVSEGVGNVWNMDEATQFTLTDYVSYGWRLSTGNEALSYSVSEDLWMHLTPAFLAQDAVWDPANLYAAAGQNYDISYTKSQMVDEMHQYLVSEQVRNVLANALGRHLLPAYIYLSLSYTGGSSTAVVEDDLETMIESVQPDDSLSVYKVSQLLSRRGAEEAVNPMVLYAMVWESDRDLKLYRSENELNLGVRYATYVGGISLSRAS